MFVVALTGSAISRFKSFRKKKKIRDSMVVTLTFGGSVGTDGGNFGVRRSVGTDGGNFGVRGSVGTDGGDFGVQGSVGTDSGD